MTTLVALSIAMTTFNSCKINRSSEYIEELRQYVVMLEDLSMNIMCKVAEWERHQGLATNVQTPTHFIICSFSRSGRISSNPYMKKISTLPLTNQHRISQAGGGDTLKFAA
jgi:hypothetical protein